MDSLCGRARSAMNLILLLTLLQAWVIFTDRPGISEKIDSLSSHMKNVSKEYRPQAMPNLWSRLDVLPSASSNLRNNPLLSAHLSDILEFSGDNFSPEISKAEERKRRLKETIASLDVKLGQIKKVITTDPDVVLKLAQKPRPKTVTDPDPDDAAARVLEDNPATSHDFFGANFPMRCKSELERFGTPSEQEIARCAAKAQKQMLELDEMEASSASLELSFVEQDLKELRSAVLRSSLSPNATLEDLMKASVPELDVPFIKERIDARVAFWVLGAASLGPLLMLISLAISLRKARIPEQVGVLDWLPLHPGAVGPFIGCVWIALPLSVTLFGMVHNAQHLSTIPEWGDTVTNGIVLVLFLFASLAVFLSMSVRRKYFAS